MNNDQEAMSDWLTDCESNGIWVKVKQRSRGEVSLKLRNVTKRGYDKCQIKKVRSNLFQLTYQGILIFLLLEGGKTTGMNMFIYCNKISRDSKYKASVTKGDRNTYDILCSSGTVCLRF